VATRTVDVAAERLSAWLGRFADAHGAPTVAATPGHVVFTAPDGTVADCEVPFPPLRSSPASPDAGLVAHVLADRRVGVLLVRLGGYAAGVFTGPTLTSSKVGSRLVHGRNAAGGQSQQRFARRREGQARVALQEAADVAVRILGPVRAQLDAVVTGGDRVAVDRVLADNRLASLRPLVVRRVLDVPDPRLRVLQGTPRLFRSVRVRVVDPPDTGPEHDGRHS
jgi:hypothetical protein